MGKLPQVDVLGQTSCLADEAAQHAALEACLSVNEVRQNSGLWCSGHLLLLGGENCFGVSSCCSPAAFQNLWWQACHKFRLVQARELLITLVTCRHSSTEQPQGGPFRS